MMLKKSIHVGKKAAYLKFNSNLINSIILTTINLKSINQHRKVIVIRGFEIEFDEKSLADRKMERHFILL